MACIRSFNMMHSKVILYASNVSSTPSFLRLFSVKASEKIDSSSSLTLSKRKTAYRKKTAEDAESIKNYLLSIYKNEEILDNFPHKLLTKSYSKPRVIYCINPSVAARTADIISSKLKENNENIPVFEMNPGIGVLTSELINRGIKNLVVFEPTLSCHAKLQEKIESSNNKFKLSNVDLNSQAKLVYRDKVTNGKLFESMLKDVQLKSLIDSDPVLRIVGTASPGFLKYLIFNFTFQSGLSCKGKCEYYLFVHPFSYNQLTCTKNDGFAVYRYNTPLFQVLYDYEILEKFNRSDFLPWEHAKTDVAPRFQLRTVDKDFIYLVKISCKNDLLQNISENNLQALWYFFKVNLISKKRRVIPALENWIPGCGIRMLPYGINTFTEFGDLSPQEMLEIFKIFSNWPEFEDCAFHSAIDNIFLKIAEDIDEEIVDESSEKKD